MSNSFDWCPCCGHWTNYENMMYDGSDAVCKFCIDGAENPGVFDPLHGNPRCPYCWEKHTRYVKGENGKNLYIQGHFKCYCEICKEEFFT